MWWRRRPADPEPGLALREVVDLLRSVDSKVDAMLSPAARATYERWAADELIRRAGAPR